MVPQDGIEPSTSSLPMKCTATVLLGQKTNLVPSERFELSRTFVHRILNPARLPTPPRRLKF
jgi:hypothetical protein